MNQTVFQPSTTPSSRRARLLDWAPRGGPPLVEPPVHQAVSTKCSTSSCQRCQGRGPECECLLPTDLLQIVYAPIAYHGTENNVKSESEAEQAIRVDQWRGPWGPLPNESVYRRQVRRYDGCEVLVRPVVFDSNQRDIYHFAHVTSRGAIVALMVSDFRGATPRFSTCEKASDIRAALYNALGHL